MSPGLDTRQTQIFEPGRELPLHYATQRKLTVNGRQLDVELVHA